MRSELSLPLDTGSGIGWAELPAQPVRSGVFAWMDAFARGVLVLAVIAELLLVVANLVARAFLSTSITWSLESAHLALATIAFVGGAVAYSDGQHLSIQAFVNRLPAAMRELIETGVQQLILALSIGLVWNCWPLLIDNWDYRTPVLGIPVSLTLLPLVAGSILLGLYAVERLIERPRRHLIGGGIGITAVIATGYVTSPLWVGHCRA